MNFIKHTGDAMPVHSGKMVAYRTTNEHVPISHIHMPVCAGDLDWTHRPQVGRILEYKVMA